MSFQLSSELSVIMTDSPRAQILRRTVTDLLRYITVNRFTRSKAMCLLDNESTALRGNG